MAGQAHRLGRTRHGVPVIADAAGVQPDGPFAARRMGGWTRSDGHETGASVGVKEAAVSEEAPAWRRALAGRPDEGRQGFVGAVLDAGIGADIEVAAPVILE